MSTIDHLRARLQELETRGANDLYEAFSAPEGRAKYLIKRALRSAVLYGETLATLKREEASPQAVVDFHCPKDSAVEECCRMFFKEKFDQVLSWHRGSSIDELAMFQSTVRQEAKRQEWYDYDTDDEGKRHVLYDEDGKPKLLVPEIRIIHA